MKDRWIEHIPEESETNAVDPTSNAKDKNSDEPNIRDELLRWRLLSPWTMYVVSDPTLSEKENQLLTTNVRDQVLVELEVIFKRLRKQLKSRNASGIMSKDASATRLECQLLVEAKKLIKLSKLTNEAKNVIIASRFATLTTASSPLTSPQPQSGGNRHSTRRRTNAISQKPLTEKIKFGKDLHLEEVEECPNESEQVDSIQLQLPKRQETLHQVMDELEREDGEQEAVSQNHITSFRKRPTLGHLSPSASTDQSPGKLPARVRYIMSSRPGVSAPIQAILDEYAIPKEVIEALETHRHFHVDESSLLSSFDPIPISSNQVTHSSEATSPKHDRFPSAAHDSTAYFRRSVPLERSPVSFVLQSLDIAPVQAQPGPIDIYQHQTKEAYSSETHLLTEVQGLFDHTYDAINAFRKKLHKNQDISEVVNFAIRNSLHSLAYFMVQDGDNTFASSISSDGNATGSDAAISRGRSKIPIRLRRTSGRSTTIVRRGGTKATAALQKWQNASDQEVNGNRRRNGITLAFRSPQVLRSQYVDLIDQMCTFEPVEIDLMSTYAEAIKKNEEEEERMEDPIPIPPDLSARFERVWRQLKIDPHIRLDLAIKYSENTRMAAILPEVVDMWEVVAALILEREEYVNVLRSIVEQVPQVQMNMTAAVVAEEVHILQELAITTQDVKEAILLAHHHYNDFVMLGSDFYLHRMERDATALRQALLKRMESMADSKFASHEKV